jgi:hypothetical protein
MQRKAKMQQKILQDFGFNSAKPKVTPKPKPKSPDTGSMNGKQYDAHLRKIIAEMKRTKR